MLQYQNHKLAQQLDVQRNEINVLEDKLSQLRSKQASFDENLSAVNRVWNQVTLQRLLMFRVLVVTCGIYCNSLLSS